MGKKNKSGGGAKPNKKGNPSPPGKSGGGNRKPGKSKGGKGQGQWNQVPIGEEFFTNKEFENLVSFEELVDYNIVSNEDGTKGKRLTFTFTKVRYHLKAR